MTANQPERQQTLVTLFKRAALAIVQELNRRVASAGYPDIRATDSQVFENLDPHGTRLSDLAKRAQMTHQSMGELVAGLEARGYLERHPDPDDRRARLISFSPRGRKLMRIALTELADIEAEWLADLAGGSAWDGRAMLSAALETREHATRTSEPEQEARSEAIQD